MRKRDRLKHQTRRQIERLMAKAKRSWMSMNETLKDGKWDKAGDLKMMVDEHECINCGADVAEDGYCAECQMCKECCECVE